MESAKDEAIRKFTNDHLFNSDPSVGAEQTEAGKTPGTNVVIWRDGKAPTIEVPQKVVLLGTIKSPGLFLENRISKGLHDSNKCHFIFDRENFETCLNVDENYSKGTRVRGKLEIHPVLVAFGINTGTRVTQKGMFEFFRQNKMYFSDGEEHRKLVAKLGDYSAKLQTEVNSKNDLAGNTLESLETKLMLNEIPMSFALTTKIFKGEEKKKFRVDLIVDVSSRSVQFVLDSVELRELIETDRDVIFDAEIAKFSTAGVLAVEGDCGEETSED